MEQRIEWPPATSSTNVYKLLRDQLESGMKMNLLWHGVLKNKDPPIVETLRARQIFAIRRSTCYANARSADSVELAEQYCAQARQDSAKREWN